MSTLDFAAVKAENPIADVVGRWVELKKAGNKYKALCPFHTENSASFYVYPDKESYTCYGCGEHGDVIDFVGKMESVTVTEAYVKLDGKTLAKPNGVRAPKPLPPRNTENDWIPMACVPDDAPDFDPNRIWNPSKDCYSSFNPARIYKYETPSGLAGYVLRIEYDTGKFIMPLTFCTAKGKTPRWSMKGFSSPRPIFNWMALKARPLDPVIIVEGEKSAEAAARLLPGYVVVTWQGGANAVSQADFSPLMNRRITLWPDSDDAGVKAMHAIAQILHIDGTSSKILNVQGQPAGWDAADAEAEGFDTPTTIAWCKERITEYSPELPPQPAPPEDSESTPLAPERAFRFRHISEVIANPRAPDWLVKGFLESNTLSMLFSDPGVGKSFLAVDLAASVAAGIEWHGHRVTKGPVLYIAGEGLQGISRRFNGWQIARQHQFNDDHLFISQGNVGLSDPASASDVFLAVQRLAESLTIMPKLIIIDTVARSFGAADENSTKDMSQYIQALDQLRNMTEAAILLIHHTGRQEKDRARGAMALTAALDFEYRLSKEADDETKTLTLHATKSKDHEAPADLCFKICTVETGIVDEDGEAVNSGVVNRVELPSHSFGDGEVKGGSQKTILGLISRHAFAHGGGDPTIDYKELKKMAEDDGMSRQTFSAAYKALKRDRKVHEGAGYVSLTIAARTMNVT